MNTKIKVLRGSTLFVSYRGNSRIIDIRKVVFIRKDGRRLVFHLITRGMNRIRMEEVTVYGKLSDLTGLLGENFLWCSRGIIVNMDGIYSFRRGHIVMKTGEKIYLSRDIYRLTKGICAEYYKNLACCEHL